MMDPKRVIRPHQSKFVKQFFYYIIVYTLQIRRVKILISNVNYLNQLDGFDSESCDGWTGRGCHHVWHYEKSLQPHPLPYLRNAGSWLGCLRSRSNLQHPLLCSASFSGLSLLQLLFFWNFNSRSTWRTSRRSLSWLLLVIRSICWTAPSQVRGIITYNIVLEL